MRKILKFVCLSSVLVLLGGGCTTNYNDTTVELVPTPEKSADKFQKKEESWINFSDMLGDYTYQYPKNYIFAHGEIFEKPSVITPIISKSNFSNGCYYRNFDNKKSEEKININGKNICLRIEETETEDEELARTYYYTIPYPYQDGVYYVMIYSVFYTECPVQTTGQCKKFDELEARRVLDKIISTFEFTPRDSYDAFGWNFKVPAQLKLENIDGRYEEFKSWVTESPVGRKKFRIILAPVDPSMRQGLGNDIDKIRDNGRAIYLGSAVPAKITVKRNFNTVEIPGVKEDNKIPVPSIQESYVITSAKDTMAFVGFKYDQDYPPAEVENLITSFFKTLNVTE